jgi:hypothetical protein
VAVPGDCRPRRVIYYYYYYYLRLVAVCMVSVYGFRHSAKLPSNPVSSSSHCLAVCPILHTATSSSCARQRTHGDKLLHCATDRRGGFAVCFLSVSVCPWHTATTRIPVVHVMDYFNGGFSYFQEGFYSNEISILW